MTGGISSTQLARMRATVNTLLPGTAVIQSVSNASDGAGGWSETWAAVSGGTVSCRLDPVRNQDVVQLSSALGRETLSVMYQMTVPYDAPLAENRRVVIAARTYEVVKLDDVHSWDVSRRAIVVEAR